MGRPPRHAEATILEVARKLSAEVGPQKLTIAAVAERAGAPVGSIYHRYASRDEILAAVWLELVEKFQSEFLAPLGAPGDTVEAGLAAVAFTCRWLRAHPLEARLMLLYRREDFACDRWSEGYRQRAQRLAEQSGQRLKDYAARLFGRAGQADLRRVRFAIVDIPTAALRRDLEAGEVPSKALEALLMDTCAHVLRSAVTTAPSLRRPAEKKKR